MLRELRLLLVNIDTEDVKNIEQLFEGVPFSIFFLSGDKKLKEEIGNISPDIILIDFNHFHQIETNAIKEMKEGGKIFQTFLLLNSAKEKLPGEFSGSGIDDYILKPDLKRLALIAPRILEINKIFLERNRLLKALTRSENLYNLITDNTNDLISVMDNNAYFLYASPSFEKILGFVPTDIIGQNYFSFIHPDDRDNLLMLFDKQIKDENIMIEVRIKNIREEWFNIEAERKWIEDDKGAAGKIVITARDTTMLKKAQEELKKSRHIFEESARLKTRFLSFLSHEIRTPLNVMLGYSNIIKESIPQSDEMENFTDYFFFIERAGKKILSTITQILDLTRIDAGEFPVEIETLPLKYLIRSNIDTLKLQAGEKNIILKFRQPEKEIFILADEYCLVSLIRNFVMELINRLDKGAIDLSIGKTKEHADIIIRSSEKPFPEDFIERISLVLFNKSENPEKIEAEEPALSLVKRLLDLMNGTCRLENTADKKMKIIFEFTLSQQEMVSI